jgi:hypothetical protein
MTGEVVQSGMDRRVRGGYVKKQMLFLLLSVSVILPLLSGQSNAQCTVSTLKAQVPFDFTIRNRQFPAGDYTFQNECGVLSLRNPQSRVVGVFITQRGEAGKPQHAGRLIFFHRDGLNVLSSIAWEREAALSILVSAKRETDTTVHMFHSVSTSSAAGGRP